MDKNCQKMTKERHPDEKKTFKFRQCPKVGRGGGQGGVYDCPNFLHRFKVKVSLMVITAGQSR